MRILGRRVVFYLITALAAITVDFFIPRLMPGNPVEAFWPTSRARSARAPSSPSRSSSACRPTKGSWGST